METSGGGARVAVVVREGGELGMDVGWGALQAG